MDPEEDRHPVGPSLPDMDRPRAPTDRTRIRRHPERARYGPETVHAIVADGWVCHVAFLDDGVPFVVPTTYAPFEGGLVLHGAREGRLIRRLAEGAVASLAVTHVDGLVLARAPILHSVNYRSVVAVGRGTELTDPERKRAALDALLDHVAPGRRARLRPSTDAELAQTGVVWFPLDEASAKVRSGPPKDAPGPADGALWAGVLPLEVRVGVPEPDRHSTGPAPAAAALPGGRGRS